MQLRGNIYPYCTRIDFPNPYSFLKQSIIDTIAGCAVMNLKIVHPDLYWELGCASALPVGINMDGNELGTLHSGKKVTINDSRIPSQPLIMHILTRCQPKAFA